MTATEVMNLIRFKKPESFTVDVYNDPLTGQCCVMGFINYKVNKYYRDSIENKSSFSNSIRSKSRDFLSKSTDTNGYDISSVNNLPTGRYNQSTPKARVMALLKDMIAAGY